MYVLQKWITSPTDFWSHFSSPICLLVKPKKKELDITCRWWFQTFLACSPRKLGNDPIWLYFFKSDETITSQQQTWMRSSVPLQVAIGQAGAIHPLIRLLEDHEQRVGNTQTQRRVACFLFGTRKVVGVGKFGGWNGVVFLGGWKLSGQFS